MTKLAVDMEATRKYLSTRLPPISDTDIDALSDYILALLQTEKGENEEDLKAFCKVQLEDFLHENTAKFVEELFDWILRGGVSKMDSAARDERRQDDRVDRPLPGDYDGDTRRHSRRLRHHDNPERPRDAERGRRHSREERYFGMRSDSRPEADSSLYHHDRGGDRGRDYHRHSKQEERGKERGRARRVYQARSASPPPPRTASQSRKPHASFMKQGSPSPRLIIDKIPREKCNKMDIVQYFEQFGTIQDVRLDTKKSAAAITYASTREANDAYCSPAVIFDNRFVKVYWAPDDHPLITGASDDVNEAGNDPLPLHTQRQQHFEQLAELCKQKTALFTKYHQQQLALIQELETLPEGPKRQEIIATLSSIQAILQDLRPTHSSSASATHKPPIMKGGPLQTVAQKMASKRLDLRPRAICLHPLPKLFAELGAEAVERAFTPYGACKLLHYEDSANAADGAGRVVVEYEKRICAEKAMLGLPAVDLGEPFSVAWWTLPPPNTADGSVTNTTTVNNTPPSLHPQL